MRFLFIAVFLSALSLCHTDINAQDKKGVYVDRHGVIRWEGNNKEAAFFGVNYTAPFAYGNRAIKKMGVSPEQAIKDDVYHLSRLGLDAFRVHVWDTEISDSLGNLLNNEHLRLFDFLIAELKKRKIKTLVTPIAFWGNGYPEKDEQTGSFAMKYGKRRALLDEDAFKAQENYLKQFFKHKNPYTGLTYQQDADIIATEVNNEPQHSGPAERTTEYINRMVAAIKSAGWTKPVFYNISESPKYAAAIVKADVSGHTFQWYPTGLVAGHTLKGNYMPNVSNYKIPFDTIPAFKNRAKVVYEFDAGDVLASYMYPLMAKSFRAAGFQWATQFAYDPMATAYANTEYQTHYMNLAYTPAKAISLLIASKVFHTQARLKTAGADTLFGDFRTSYPANRSEMNSVQEFYYSNSTTSVPKAVAKLKHIAGVGSSPVVTYPGKGAYFLDQITAGVWRLELMPDAVQIRDPFEKASPSKEVTRISWADALMDIHLPDLGAGFEIKALNEGNTRTADAGKDGFTVSPGAYLLVRKGLKTQLNGNSVYDNRLLKEYAAPKPFSNDLLVRHEPLQEISANTAFAVHAEIVGMADADSAFVELKNTENDWKNIPLRKTGAYQYTAMVPGELVKAGLLEYCIRIKTGADYTSFPENKKGDPFAWDALESQKWQVNVAAKGAILELFNAKTDGKTINIYNPDWENNRVSYSSVTDPSKLNLKMTIGASGQQLLMGWQSYFGDKLQGRGAELKDFSTVVIRARSLVKGNTKLKIGFISRDAHFFSMEVELTEVFHTIEIPLNTLKQDSQLLLPRPYPGFLPLYYPITDKQAFRLQDAEKLEVTFGYESKTVSLEVESIYLK